MREAIHCLLGSYYRRHGSLDRARDHFLRALEFDEGSFRAHVHLGRVYLDQCEYRLASSELKRAREIDPHRWANELFPGEPLLWMAEHLPEQRLREALDERAGEISGSEEGVEVRELDASSQEDPVDDLPYGDFVDQSEADRFALLPPIAISEVDEIDWAELGRQLIEEE